MTHPPVLVSPVFFGDLVAAALVILLRVKKTRYIYMVRHGQYQDAEKDADRHLTEKGREQARLCGQYLKARGIKPTQFVHSSMTRATETANLINEALQAECKIEVRSYLIFEAQKSRFFNCF